jgi:hypothetical protein
LGSKERIKEFVVRELALIVAAALALFNPAVAKVVHRHPVHRPSPSVYYGKPYGYGRDHELLNDDCDVTNKAPMTTCPNGR